MSRLKLYAVGERELFVMGGDQVVATVKLNHQRCMTEVVLRADTSDEVQVDTLRLVVTRVHWFVRRLTIDQITALDRDALTTELRAVGIDVTVALYRNVREAIDAAVKKVGVPTLRYEQVPTHLYADGTLRLEFAVDQPDRFVFWRYESRPRGVDELHIVPFYHPAMNEWKQVGMVNGDTDYLIRGRAIGHFYCPMDAQTGNDLPYKGSTWSHVDHPFRAAGQTMQLEVDITKMCSAEGVDELAEVLRASLCLDETYVAISGGFQAPLKYPDNRLIETKRKSPYPNAGRGGHAARGSEAHCVWAYRTLQEEGVLDRSYVPAWFVREGWLEIYAGAEVKPGIF